MYRCQQPPMVQPVVQPVVHKYKDSFAGHFFRCVRCMVFFGAMIPISIVGFHYWAATEQAEQEARLKRDMLERGMSAQEIEKVLLASQNPSRNRSNAAESNYYTARHAEIEASLIKELAALNMSADDIERVHTAFAATNGTQAKSHSTSERATKDAAFIKRLAQSGRSAAEIERLLKVAGKTGASTEKAAAAAEKSQQAKVEDALKTLLRSGLTAEDVTKVLKSGDAAPTEESKTP